MRKNSISVRRLQTLRERLPESNKKLEEYFPVTRKSDILEKKIMIKQQEKHRRNQQTLITDWLFRNQNRSNQGHLWLKIDKPVVLLIFQFLSLTDSARVSRTCRYLHRCYNSIWLSLDYFEEFNLANFSIVELKQIMQKSTRLEHIKTVKRLFTGKNLQHYADKIRLKAIASQNGMLVSFEIEPKRANMGVFLMDENIIEICSQSYTTLTTISLISCHFLSGKSIQSIARCKKLRSFSLTKNSFIEDQHIEQIAKGCRQLISLNLSECCSLTQICFRYIGTLRELKQLDLSRFEGTMGGLCFLGSLRLNELNLSNSTINDTELSSILKFNCLESLNISGCPFVTINALQVLTKMEYCQLKRLNISRMPFSQEQIYRLATDSEIQSIVSSNVSARIHERLTANRSPMSATSLKNV